LQYTKDVRIDLPEAVKYYRLSADQGNADGQWRYGFCLESGKGVGIDLAEAVEYYRLSADQGNADGQWHYGFCLESGKGVEIDLAEAVKYYRLSAQLLEYVKISVTCSCLSPRSSVEIALLEIKGCYRSFVFHRGGSEYSRSSSVFLLISVFFAIPLLTFLRYSYR
jgi:TPR repeat protein